MSAPAVSICTYFDVFLFPVPAQVADAINNALCNLQSDKKIYTGNRANRRTCAKLLRATDTERQERAAQELQVCGLLTLLCVCQFTHRNSIPHVHIRVRVYTHSIP